MNSYDWIFFDADNTLFDFDLAEASALQSVVTSLGLPFAESHRETYQKINKACWTDFENGKLPKSALRTIRFEKFLDAFGLTGDPAAISEAYLHHLSQSTFLIEGVYPLLSRLAGNYRMAIVTNGLKEVQRPRFNRSEILPFFELVVVSDEIGVAKPDPGFFDYAFAQIGKPAPKRVIIVGDNLNSDIRGGEAYGMDTCWYNPHQVSLDFPVQPTYEIQSWDELERILQPDA